MSFSLGGRFKRRFSLESVQINHNLVEGNIYTENTQYPLSLWKVNGNLAYYLLCKNDDSLGLEDIPNILVFIVLYKLP